MRSVLVVASLLLASGCTTWNGHNEAEAQIKHVTLESNNFRVVKSDIRGEASCAYVFPMIAPNILGCSGILGIALGDTQLFAKAYEELRAEANLTGAQQIHNVVEEIAIKPNFLVYGVITLTVTADVIEFTGDYVDYKTR